jgi:hypothetical protein
VINVLRPQTRVPIYEYSLLPSLSQEGIPSLDLDLAARCFPSHRRTLPCHCPLGYRCRCLLKTIPKWHSLKCLSGKFLWHLAKRSCVSSKELTINVDMDIFFTTQGPVRLICTVWKGFLHERRCWSHTQSLDLKQICVAGFIAELQVRFPGDDSWDRK